MLSIRIEAFFCCFSLCQQFAPGTDWQTLVADLLFSLESKGLAKLGNIVAETLLRMQMFPNLAARETCVAETNFAARKQKMFLSWSQKHFCFPDTNVASET